MKSRLQMVEDDLVKIMSRWDPSFLEGPKVSEKIKDEIKFSGLSPQTEQLYLMYVEKNFKRLLELVRSARANHYLTAKR
jgi:hypothetical protein